VQNKAKELLTNMKKDLNSLFVLFLGKLRAILVQDFDNQLQKVLPQDDTQILENFAQVMAQIKNGILTTFNNKAKSKLFVESTKKILCVTGGIFY
jgi:hypothetical protein